MAARERREPGLDELRGHGGSTLLRPERRNRDGDAVANIKGS